MSKDVSAGAAAVVPPNPDYPARLDIDYPVKSSRLLLFFRGILVLPHYFILMVLGLVAWIGLLVAWLSVLITAHYPKGIFSYLSGVIRYGVRVVAYQMLLTDKYPPFGLGDHPRYPVRIEIDRPPNMHIHRWRALLQGLLAYPAAIAGGVLMLLAYFGVIFAWFVILFRGRFPRRTFRFVTIAFRWTLRTTVFQYLMTERYPPFVMA
jgi:hypothetical protein